MKKFPTFLLAGALIFPAALSAATFEGKVTVNMISPRNAPQPITFNIKEGFSRVDMEVGKKGQSMSMIMDAAKQEMIMLMPAQKMYMVEPLPKPEPSKETDKPSRDDVTFEKTNETAKILGYDCVKYLTKSKDGTSEIWVTDQLGTFMGMSAGKNPMGGRSATQSQAWEKALIGKNFFPLRTVVLGTDGKETFRMEATAVEKQSLPASLFAPPADFKKFEMPNIGDMMKGMIPGH